MSESADDLSKFDEISLNQDASPNQDENSPNFTDTYNAWHEMLETENRGVAGRVADLERKVLEQGDELVCLKGRWHFDASALTCVQFVYGGCRGNQNNFLTFEECLNTCAVVKDALSGNDSAAQAQSQSNEISYNFRKICQN
ncbi:hypothetical protein HUJ04_006003 [Dendroctonus ponderosae]|nr:hypothetical protein HUJ04_006003 [Dendroctonus ponderosae]